MAAPLWSAGHLYFPGDIVQPITAPATTPVAIPNPGFETGTDTGWTLGPATAVSSADKFTGTYSIEFTGTGGITDTLQATASAVQVGQSITARVMYQQGAASAGHNGGRVLLAFYTSGMVLIGTPSLGNVVDSGSGGAWGQSTVTAVAPATAAFVKVGIRVNRTNGSPSWADDFTWNHVAQAPAGLVFKAVQPAAGTSGTSEPAWPNTVGLTVVDNQVTWEAIAATRVEWTAAPILVSGATEPTWPTTIGEFVADGSIKWEAFSRRVEDENCPNTKIVAIVGSKVFAADRDIARFCATANPLDWTTQQDAGYLPLGLQQANANDFNTGVFNQYRSNFVAFNASSFQNWQADPDPSAMALLDQMDGVGSTWQQAAQPVANDLFYLAALGVRTVGIAGGSTNLQAGDVGMPIDPLVKDAVRIAIANSSAVRSTYYPSSGQYWLAFADFPPDAPAITGNIPDGVEGQPVSGAYVITGGVQPYGPVTVLSGTFPPTITLNADGSYSGTYPPPGTYTFTVGGVDADGQPFSTPDTVIVSVVPQVILYAELDTAGAHAYRIGYGVWNDNTSSVDFIASKTYVDGDGTSTSPKRPGVTLDGDIIAVVPDTWNGTTVAGVYALRPNGANLDEIAHYRSSTEEFAQYHGVVLSGDDILAACPDPVNSSEVVLVALSWNGTAFTQITSLNIGNVGIREINGHKNGVAVLLSNQQVRFYSYDGATITAAGSYTHPLTGANRDAVSVVSDANYLYLDNGLILEAAAGSVTLHAQIPWGGTNFPPLGRIAIKPGYIAIYNRSGDYGVIPVNTLGVWSFNGTSTALVTSTACDVPRGDYAMVWSEDRLYLADLFDTAGSGNVFTFDGATLTRVADMELPAMAGNDTGASLWVGEL